MTTTLTQASQQWMSRPADERFECLIEMQVFKRRLRERSTSQVISSLVSRCTPPKATRMPC
jgi:hypothetical protein